MPLVSTDFEQKPLEILRNSNGYKLDRLKQSTTGFKREVKLVDTLNGVQDACKHLEKFKELAVDCEGVCLGRDGKLTLIQVSANNDTAFIFDVLVLGKEMFNQGLKVILESGSIKKYMFDCRGDSDSLMHEYNVKITNVFDMQLFEFMVRPVAGKSFKF